MAQKAGGSLMAGIYLTWLADVLRAAGLPVVECQGWQTRARSSGGFPETPLGVQWHHTASQTTPENDTNYQIYGSDDAPIGNLTLMRDGSVWLVAAGAANTAGKGGPLTLSRGTIPVDSGNTRSVAMEVANSGTGEPWPEIQVNAYFIASNAINAQLGNLPTDVFTHSLGTGGGWTDRKIDPATAAAVQGPWQPRSVNSSGTWSLDDIRAECSARAGQQPEPTPPQPPQDDDTMSKVTELVQVRDAVFAVVDNGVSKFWVSDGVGVDHIRYRWGLPDGTTVIDNEPTMTALGPVTNCDVPSLSHGGLSLLQQGYNLFGWKP